MARIALDATALDAVNPGSGQYRYLVDLVRGLRELGSGDTYVLWGSRESPPPELLAVFRDPQWTYRRLVPVRARGGAYVDQVRWAARLFTDGMDLLHALHTFVPVLTRVPLVVTVYDLMFELFPEYAEAAGSRAWRRYRDAVRHRARRVIAISRTTAEDLARRWGVPADRMDVVPLGSDAAAAGPMVPPPGLARLAGAPCLVVSPFNLEPRKNLSALLRAAAVVRQDEPALQLVLYGRGAVSKQRESAFAAEVSALGLDGAVVLTGLLPVPELTWLYAQATLFAFPSLYEGFGLPVLEAMGAGTCVVARNASAMAEVLGDAGVLVETRDATALAAAMLSLLRDPARRQELGARARRRAADFTVHRMAAETQRTYERALGGGLR